MILRNLNFLFRKIPSNFFQEPLSQHHGNHPYLFLFILDKNCHTSHDRVLEIAPLFAIRQGNIIQTVCAVVGWERERFLIYCIFTWYFFNSFSRSFFCLSWRLFALYLCTHSVLCPFVCLISEAVVKCET
jgi:hypothetical protein